jgi:hypothetical protein
MKKSLHTVQSITNDFTMSCASASVWVLLYYKEETEPVGQAFRIRPIPETVDALKDAVHAKLASALTHCDAPSLYVYAPGITVPIPAGTEALDSGDTVLTDTTSKTPLIVIAPKLRPPEQQVSFFGVAALIMHYALCFALRRVIVFILIATLLRISMTYFVRISMDSSASCCSNERDKGCVCC